MTYVSDYFEEIMKIRQEEKHHREERTAISKIANYLPVMQDRCDQDLGNGSSQFLGECRWSGGGLI